MNLVFIMTKTEWVDTKTIGIVGKIKLLFPLYLKLTPFMSQSLPPLVISHRSSHSFYYLDPEDVSISKRMNQLSHILIPGEHKMYFTFSFLTTLYTWQRLKKTAS